MSKIYVNEIQTLDAGSVTFATGTNVVLNGSITVGGEISGTLSSSAISNITSLGTLTSLDVSGNITVGGTVDGVDIASFKTAYDSHSHGDLYYTETEVDTLLTNSANWDTAYGWGDHAGLYSLLGHTHTESEVTDFGNYITDVTHDTVNTKLVVTKRDATTTDLSLTQYLDDTNLARLVSGSLDSGTFIATFTRDDASTFTIDFSSLLQNYTAGSGLTLTGTSFSHSDTSSAADLTASGRRYVTGLTFDDFGHITGYTTGTETVVDTNTTYSAGAGLSLSGTTFSHADTSTQASVNNAGRTYIQDITLDEYGHITGIASATETVVNTDTTYTAGSGLSLSGTTFSHSDTSTAANLTASGRTYVTGLTFDTYGHVTGYTTGTETVVNTDTNTTYTAGSGLTLSGTTFSLQPDLRGEAYIIGRDNNDYFVVDTTEMSWVLDGAVDMRLYNSGDLHVEGNVVGYSTSISDQKFKDDVTPIESALDKVKALKGVEYTWNATSKKGKRDLGFIAQEVEQVIPQIVTEHTLSTGEFADNPTQSKTIDYEKITAVLVEAVKEQQAQIEELKAKLDGYTK